LQRCQACGFIFLAEVPPVEEAVHYEEAFAQGNVHPTYRKGPDGRYEIQNADKLGRLLDLFERYRATGRLLDVGCSAAFFLKLAQDRGWTARGVEISSWAGEFSRKELGLDVFTGTLHEAAFPDGMFDVVFSSHVLEHIGDPVALVREMRRVLRPGGAVVSVLPSQFASPTWRIRGRFLGDPPPKHVSFFKRSSFERMLRKAGLQPVRTRYNVELMRLYEMLLSERQLGARWEARVAGGSSGSPAPGTPTVGGAHPAVRFAKGVVNALGNASGFGDEIVSIAIKPAG